MAAFPHFVLDRSKPGIVTVGRDGRRFVNESRSYHEFVGAMYAANRDGSTIPAYLIADSVALKKYGLGMVRPGGRRPAALPRRRLPGEAPTPRRARRRSSASTPPASPRPWRR